MRDKAYWFGFFWGVLSTSLFFIFVYPAVAHADANTFLAYVHGHQINTGLANDSKLLHAGMFACDSLHAGQTVDQIANTPSLMDVRGIVDAAQRELCPDTLGH